MNKIIAIGGGEIGRPGTKIETLLIDKEIIKLTKKKNPRLLFIPTASGDSTSYVEIFNNYFGKKLKCHTGVLFLINKRYSRKYLEKIILNVDMIYVGGGNTLNMMNVWRKNKINEILKKATEKGIVLSGVSAGANCWFDYGYAGRPIGSNKKLFNLKKVKGLGIIKGSFCPHYDFDKYRKIKLKKILKNKKEKVLAIDNGAAIEILENKYKIISANESSNAHLVFYEENKYIEKKIAKDKWLDLKDLFNTKITKKYVNK